jgi:hypothetical protein
MNKLVLIIALFFFSPPFIKAQTPKITFIDWDSIRNQVDLYKINEREITRFNEFLGYKDSVKITQFQILTDSFTRHSLNTCYPSPIFMNKCLLEQKKVIEFDSLIQKVAIEFSNKSKE